MDDRSIKIDKLVNRPKVSSAVKVLRYADQLDESTHLEDALHRVQSFEKLRSLVVAGVEAAGTAVDQCWEDKIGSCSVTADTSEYVWNANELLHFTIVLLLDLLHWRSELNSLTTTNMRSPASPKLS